MAATLKHVSASVDGLEEALQTESLPNLPGWTAALGATAISPRRYTHLVANGPEKLFRIKICGITSPKDAQYAILAGADAIGLNFYEPSSRFVDIETAERACQIVGSRAAKVGVFVDACADEIVAACDRLQLDFVQLHGNESVEFGASLGDRPLLRVLRLGADSDAALAATVASWRKGVPQLAGILVDAHVDGMPGGTGETLDWQAAADRRQDFGDTPLILAGGLTPSNVAAAIATVRPYGVDVASGVESEPGKKDLVLIRAFCSAAKKALSAE